MPTPKFCDSTRTMRPTTKLRYAAVDKEEADETEAITKGVRILGFAESIDLPPRFDPWQFRAGRPYSVGTIPCGQQSCQGPESPAAKLAFVTPDAPSPRQRGGNQDA